eukprot:TRINITY_DN18708_c0_g2_i1.p1 TRINITY_DN18708_c0_g2~~TRINITY_DN18708_c0_g2_i1.p1  ORF type:complete len:591 (-),score=110.85 TRINITY_DN18708_c0_g2_i1:108-1880(-)
MAVATMVRQQRPAAGGGPGAASAGAHAAAPRPKSLVRPSAQPPPPPALPPPGVVSAGSSAAGPSRPAGSSVAAAAAAVAGGPAGALPAHGHGGSVGSGPAALGSVGAASGGSAGSSGGGDAATRSGRKSPPDKMLGSRFPPQAQRLSLSNGSGGASHASQPLRSGSASQPPSGRTDSAVRRLPSANAFGDRGIGDAQANHMRLQLGTGSGRSFAAAGRRQLTNSTEKDVLTSLDGPAGQRRMRTGGRIPSMPPGVSGGSGGRELQGNRRDFVEADLGGLPLPDEARRTPTLLAELGPAIGDGDRGARLTPSDIRVGADDFGRRTPVFSDAGEREAAREESTATASNKEPDDDKKAKEVAPVRRKLPSGVIETFLPHMWLNDASISFGYNCVGDSKGFRAGNRKLPKGVLLMDPATAFWLCMQDDPVHIKEALDGIKLPELELLLCPVNDSRDASEADVGTHWTLLACWAPQPRPFQRFSYYDSFESGAGVRHADASLRQAEKLASRLAGKPVKLSSAPCPQQTNAFDCGVYVLLFSEIIVSAFLDAPHRPAKGGGGSEAPVWQERLRAVSPEEVTSCREHYHRLASSWGT